MKPLKFGILGMSDGNGHPYSWAAIFNGYNPKAMAKCPFPVIPDYLSKQNFPTDALSGAQVTHIWAQSRDIAEHIAQSSLIEHIVDDYEEMIGQVDGVLLARDDAENHLEMSKPFLEAGLPVYIDKPIALSVKELETIFSYEQYPGQIFSCSAMRYAQEFDINDNDRLKLGNLLHIHATVPKKWETYAVHIIEPVLLAIGNQGPLERVNTTRVQDKTIVDVIWQSGVTTTFSVLGKGVCPLGMTVYGTKAFKEYVFQDTFSAFKAALAAFLDSVRYRKPSISHKQMKTIVEIIERGQSE